MRFTEFVKATILAVAGVAVALGLVSVVVMSLSDRLLLTGVGLGWWIVAFLVGIFAGRSGKPLDGTARLMADAKVASVLPDINPWTVLVNRLWPLFAIAAVSVGLSFVLAAVPIAATGYALLWALLWRREPSAVKAIEARDGALFYVGTAPVLKPLRLVRVPGLTGDGRVSPNGSVAAGRGLVDDD